MRNPWTAKLLAMLTLAVASSLFLGLEMGYRNDDFP